MIAKTITIYKGDVLSGYFYLGFSAFCLIVSLTLFQYTSRIGYTYLASGFMLFCLYTLGKGILVTYISKQRKKHYQGVNELTISQAKEELEYTIYRIEKKKTNRRRFIWTVGICILLGIIGMVINEKGLVIGTVVPICLFAAIEFCVGLLTEFRLWQYHREIEKYLSI